MSKQQFGGFQLRHHPYDPSSSSAASAGDNDNRSNINHVSTSSGFQWPPRRIHTNNDSSASIDQRPSIADQPSQTVHQRSNQQPELLVTQPTISTASLETSTSDMNRPQSAHLENRDMSTSSTTPPLKPFSGLKFVISGIQNPRRSTLRSQILDLGGQYSNQWSETCTHLICPFKNTPKFLEFKQTLQQLGGTTSSGDLGKWCVKPEYVAECVRLGRRVAEESYLLEPILPPPYTSEDDHDDSSESESDGDDTSAEQNEEAQERMETNDEEGEGRITSTINERQAEPEPTEDETVMDQPPRYQVPLPTPQALAQLPRLPDLFTGKRFLLSPSLSADEKKKLTRYIYAYDGEAVMASNESDAVEYDYVLAYQKQDGYEGPTLSPDYVITAHQTQTTPILEAFLVS